MAIHAVDPVPSLDSYLLRSLLYCTCGKPFFPWGWTQNTRTYLSLCGCRLQPIDANVIERRVHAEAGLIGGTFAMDETGARALTQLFSRIEVGGTVEDIRLLRRT